MSFKVKTKHITMEFNSAPLDRITDPTLLLDDVTMQHIHAFILPFYDKYTPKSDQSIMAGDAQALAEFIFYKGPYAHYIWEGRLMVDPDTGSAWAKRYAKKVYADPEVKLQYQDAAATAHWDDTAWANHKEEMIEGITGILVQRAKELSGGPNG